MRSKKVCLKAHACICPLYSIALPSGTKPCIQSVQTLSMYSTSQRASNVGEAASIKQIKALARFYQPKIKTLPEVECLLPLVRFSFSFVCKSQELVQK